jgi:hypothetical protein
MQADVNQLTDQWNLGLAKIAVDLEVAVGIADEKDRETLLQTFSNLRRFPPASLQELQRVLFAVLTQKNRSKDPAAAPVEAPDYIQ